MMTTGLLVAALMGCPRVAPEALPPSEPSRYEVGTVLRSGEQVVTAMYTMSVRPAGPEQWTLATTRTRGSWTSDAVEGRFDSAAPHPGDPWPLLQQHAVSSVPATVALDRRGRPMGLVDPASWEDAATGALRDLALPGGVTESGRELVDPDGLVRDLQRLFPGTPTSDWRRPERIAGLPCVRAETCTVRGLAGRRRWRCTGVVEGPSEGGSRLKAGESWTTLILDRHGIRSVESGYAGVLLMVDPETNGVRERMVGGQRALERR